MGSLDYYKSFPFYRIEKKISVEDHAKVKDYAKKGIYFYVIHEHKDNNRFIFVSNSHYEEESKIPSNQFKLQKIVGDKEQVLLKERVNQFGETFFRVTKDDSKENHKVLFAELIGTKSKQSFFMKYKCHWKKLAMDNPSWYLEVLKKTNKCSYKKHALSLILCKNRYSEEHINHMISTFFIFDDSKFQMFNDHSIVMDEGKTGKSSLISYMGEKVDNVSIAGLYGSSDSLRGKFKGGLVTTTKKPIAIDEINEMISNNKGEKVLSILNTPLENGVYNYQKQFSQKLFIKNQFFFFANIKNDCNFPILLEHTFGNVATFGRRIGIITYDSNLKGFQAGNLRPLIPHEYLIALQGFCSKLLNEFFKNQKNIEKLYAKKKYFNLVQFYEGELTKLESSVEEETTRAFIKSHKKSILRQFTRAFKLYIWKHLDDFIKEEKNFDNHTHSEVLDICEEVLKKNILSFKNIIEEVQNNNYVDRKEERNKLKFNSLPKYYQNMIEFFFKNSLQLSNKGTTYSLLSNKHDIKKYIMEFKKNKKVPTNLKQLLIEYGCHMDYNAQENEVMFRFINQNTFDKTTSGLFDDKISEVKFNEDEKKENIIDEIGEEDFI